MSKEPTRRIRLRRVVAYPAISMALVVSVALAMTPLGPSRVMALVSPTTPAATAEPTTAVPTTAVPTTAVPTTAVPTTAVPTTVVPTTVVPTTAATTALGPVPSPAPGLAPTAAATAGTPLEHHVLARIEGSDFHATYLAVDAPMLGASQFQTFRVRFQVRNNGTVPITATPRLEYRADGAAGFAVVPDQPELGIAFNVAREWIPSLGLGGGTDQGPLGEDIPVVDLKTPSKVGVAVIGHHSMGANPDKPITLPAASYTEEEFTVRLTTDATYLTGYDLRITDGGTALTGTQVARIVLGPPPALNLSAGQREGVPVDDPKAANAAGVVYPLVSEPPTAPATTTATATTTMTAVPAAYTPSTAAYPLASGSLSPATVASSSPVTVAVTSGTGGTPHDMTTAQCGSCHRGHAAPGPNLLAQSQQSTLCFTCHNGSGAGKDVQSQYALARPTNNPVTREYYSHDALAPSTTHTQSQLDEFGGVSNRHSECADCHNSHKASGTDSTPTADGWDASGRLAGVSGVSVANGAAGAAPTYTFLNGVTNLVTREYQLCFKCHSGSTVLTSNAGLKPSQYALDKGVEFNPANPSFHPVEAAGKNTTPKMDESLAGTSPYKLWNFTSSSTIRCLNCHASGTTPDTTPTPLPLPGSSLPPHTSSNRGILLKNYQDRQLKATGAAYSAGDFALCFVCHAEEPFANETANKTNFPLHGKHLTGLANRGSGGTDIDTPADGQGNAICAECHFRIHSTTDKVGTQAITGSRLVNFAPNVEPITPGGTLSWTQDPTTGGGTCSLTCHGYSHTRTYP